MKLFASIAVVANKVKKDYVSAFAAQSALFLIMSFVPFLILLLTLVKYTPLSKDAVLTFINNFSPEAFKNSFNSIANQVYESVNPSFLVITSVSVLWIAGKGVHSLIDGFNSVYEINEKRNAFVIRLYSIFYTVIFLILLVFAIILFILGNEVLNYFNRNVPVIANIIDTILSLKTVLSVSLFTILFTVLYVALPSRRSKLRHQLPGALFAAVGWTGFSFFFSLYVNYSKTLSFLYGSLSTIVCTMLWLYVCMFILLLGAEINVYVEQWNMGKSVEKATDITHTPRTGDTNSDTHQ